jgi:hypothetical protein
MGDIPKNAIDEIAHDYIRIEKKWGKHEYVLERNEKEEGEDLYAVTVSHRDDERAAIPGGGKSVCLIVDVRARKVVKELHFQ